MSNKNEKHLTEAEMGLWLNYIGGAELDKEELAQVAALSKRQVSLGSLTSLITILNDTLADTITVQLLALKTAIIQKGVVELDEYIAIEKDMETMQTQMNDMTPEEEEAFLEQLKNADVNG